MTIQYKSDPITGITLEQIKNNIQYNSMIYLGNFRYIRGERFYVLLEQSFFKRFLMSVNYEYKNNVYYDYNDLYNAYIRYIRYHSFLFCNIKNDEYIIKGVDKIDKIKSRSSKYSNRGN